MPRPSSVFSWAALSSIWRATPPTLNRDQGFEPLTPSVAEYVNQVLKEIGDWIGYVEAFFPQDGEINAGKITGTGDPDGSGRGLVITTDGTGSGIGIGPATNDDLVLQTLGTGDIDLVSSRNVDITAGSSAFIGLSSGGIQVLGTGFIRFTGGVSWSSSTDFLRFRYDPNDPPLLELSVWPGMGGWMLITDPLGSGSFTWTIDANGFVVTNSGGLGDCNLRLPLPGILGNLGNEGLNAVVYRFESLTSEWNATQRDVDPSVRLIQRLKVAPYTEVILATVDYFNDTDNTAVDLTPRTHEYYLSFLASGMANLDETTPLESLRVIITKYAVE